MLKMVDKERGLMWKTTRWESPTWKGPRCDIMYHVVLRIDWQPPYFGGAW